MESIMPLCAAPGCSRWSFFRCPSCGTWVCPKHEHSCAFRGVWAQKIRCWLGLHVFDKIEAFEPTGFATLAWSLRPEREFRSVKSCACGAQRVESGLLNFQDRERNAEAYPGDGYPVNEDGMRMPVAP